MKLSIIVPVYNLEDYIAECLQSLADIQLSPDEYEVLVIDDGSTDGSESVINTLVHKYPQIQYFYQNNKGVGAARNLGIQHAKGDYLWFVDGDDFVYSDKVKQGLEEAFINDLDVLTFNFTPVNEKGLPQTWVSFNFKSSDRNIVSGSEFYYYNYAKSYLWLCFFKRRIFLQHNLTFQNSIKMQDGEIFPRIMIHCQSLKHFNERLIYYRYREQSAVNSKNENARAHFYFSMVIVADSLRMFQQQIDRNENILIYKALSLKRKQLNQMLFTNFILNKYSYVTNKKFITLLKKYELLPFMKITGFTIKMNLVFNIVRHIVNVNPIVGRHIYQLIFKK
ncbi:glycosyltransferase [Anditalea andensis]|uniref:Glycosyltransferase 2-like domain-containing protein n=1 Tax=Anditalea andensis TaxID=1048983 RepID=A0A074LFN8_9BACT|nr:glycosyltransferase [Anditalea andensis]KEO72592.1 hypothetical protein EL17_17800 [Anditalea andensis]